MEAPGKGGDKLSSKRIMRIASILFIECAEAGVRRFWDDPRQERGYHAWVVLDSDPARISSDLLNSLYPLDSTGALITDSEKRYMPFGDVRSDLGTANQTDFGYTGQREIEGSELMDYHARFLNPGLGRFTQPDAIIPDPVNPQTLNRYAYTLNNPVKYTDPSGHGPEDPDNGNGEDEVECDVNEDSGMCDEQEAAFCSLLSFTTNNIRKYQYCFVPEDFLVDNLPKDQQIVDPYLLIAWIYLMGTDHGKLYAQRVLDNPDMTITWADSSVFKRSTTSAHYTPDGNIEFNANYPVFGRPSYKNINDDIARIAAIMGHELYHDETPLQGKSVQEEVVAFKIANSVYGQLTGKIYDESVLDVDVTSKSDIRNWVIDHRRNSYYLDWRNLEMTLMGK